MATYDLRGRLILAPSATESHTAIRELLDQTYTESTELTYVVPSGSTDLALPLGGVSSASVVWIESMTSSETWTYKINDSGNTATTMTGQAYALYYGATITALYVTVPGSNDVTIRVLAVS